MKIIIAGGRNFDNYSLLKTSLDNLFTNLKREEITIVSGHAAGADALGEQYANQNNLDLVIFPANWRRRGKCAGPYRNLQMATFADCLVAFWDGSSRGTAHMIETMKGMNKPFRVIRY